MKYRSQWPTFILKSSIKSHWLIIPRYHVYTSNSLQAIRQSHWTMKYRSQWPTFILKSSIKSYWLIILRYHVYTSNSLQNIRQNHWTMKYRSQWPTFILRSIIKSYWLIITRYYVNTSKSLKDIRQNHSSSSSDFWLTCRYRGHIHNSGPPSRQLACCTHDRSHTRSPGVSIMRVNSWELPLSAIPLRQLLPSHLGPPRPTLSINLYVKGCLDCTVGAFHMSIPAEPSLFQYEVQVFNSEPCK